MNAWKSMFSVAKPQKIAKVGATLVCAVVKRNQPLNHQLPYAAINCIESVRWN